MEKYAQLIKNSRAYKKLAAEDTQSYLITGKDELGLRLLCDAYISDRNGKANGADVARLPFGDKVLVSDVEFITQNAAVTPTELNKRYFVVSRAETMNESAANKLLKTLEEPPPACVIILLAQSERALLPTIRSRCRIIELLPFNEDELVAVAEQYYADSPYLEMAKAINLGNLTRLSKALSGGYEATETLVFDTLTCMRKSSQIVIYAQKLIKRKDEINDIIEYFDFAFQDLLMYEVSPSLVRNRLRMRDYGEIAKFFNTDTILRLRPIFTLAYERIIGAGNINSIVDEFLFSLLEVRQKCQRL